MFDIEAKELTKLIFSKMKSKLGRTLNLGSTTTDLRQKSIIKFQECLIDNSNTLCNVDIKNGPGVHLVANIMDEEGFKCIEKFSPTTVIATNILEHVLDPKQFIKRILEIKNLKYILITVPYNYPFHPDPIDNGFRPSPKELLKIVPNYKKIIHSDIIKKEKPKIFSLLFPNPFLLLYYIVRSLLPYPSIKISRYYMSTLLKSVTKNSVSVIFLEL